MNQAVAIVTDSTSDLPSQEAERLGIQVVPALLMMEGRTYLDGRELTREEFYRRLPGLSSPPTTAAPSPASFEAVYRK
ncbi:MAG TPA: DegV family protein, partial [Chloroflexi bacterium]|nr:DegV family protein [Chloroflexota bacterium]